MDGKIIDRVITSEYSGCKTRFRNVKKKNFFGTLKSTLCSHVSKQTLLGLHKVRVIRSFV
jgi:hypothetical protein